MPPVFIVFLVLGGSYLEEKRKKITSYLRKIFDSCYIGEIRHFIQLSVQPSLKIITNVLVSVDDLAVLMVAGVMVVASAPGRRLLSFTERALSLPRRR